MATRARRRPHRVRALLAGSGRRLIVAAIAGLALPFAFAPFGWYGLAPLSFATLFLCWRGATPGRALATGFVFGFCCFAFGVYWIYVSVGVFSPAPAALAIALTIGLAAAMAVYPAAAGWLAARWLGTDGVRVWLVALPAVWVVLEWLRGWLLTGFGWLEAGYSQTDSWLAAYAPVLGVHGVTLAVLVLGGAVAAVVAGGRRERVIAAIVAAVVVAGGAMLAGREWTEPTQEPLSAALVQGAVPQDKKWLPEQLPATMELYRSLTEEVAGTDLIVWPEAAIPQLYENMSRWLDEVGRDAAAAGSTVMFGMLRYRASGGGPENAVFALGHPELVYVKRHLVPYGEYFPVPDIVRGWLRAMNLPTDDTVPGPAGQPPFDLLGEKIAITICYEDVFGAEQLGSFPEATLLVNVSNDAWFGDSFAADQHLQIARMRALEVGRFLLRATNTGISAVVDPLGRVVSRLPQFEIGVLNATVGGRRGSTPYIVWGNWAVLGICALALVAQAAMTKFTIRPGT